MLISGMYSHSQHHNVKGCLHCWRAAHSKHWHEHRNKLKAVRSAAPLNHHMHNSSGGLFMQEGWAVVHAHCHHIVET